MFKIFRRKSKVRKYVVYMQPRGLVGTSQGPIEQVKVCNNEDEAVLVVNDTMSSKFESWYVVVMMERKCL